jgi:hypothetical protein
VNIAKSVWFDNPKIHALAEAALRKAGLPEE